MSTPLDLDLRRLAVLLVADGPEAHATTLRSLADRACSAGASSVLAAIVASPAEPPITRLRAFGLLVRELEHLGRPVRSAPRRAA